MYQDINLGFFYFYFLEMSCGQHTDQGENYQLQGPHPKEKYNYTQQLYQDVRNAWQTT